ncbi:MAG: hypothetical protein AAB871_02635 [Patescibacteria group bacterium]
MSDTITNQPGARGPLDGPAEIAEPVRQETTVEARKPQYVSVLAEDGRPYFPDECFE